MKNFPNPYLLIIFLLVFASTINAQNIENFNYKVIDGKVLIDFDLVTAKEGQEVEVRLYSILKGFDMRLYRATGDIGKEQKAGKGKHIVWKNNEELTSYNIEDMTFKLQVIAKQTPVKNVEKPKNKNLFAGFFGSEK